MRQIHGTTVTGSGQHWLELSMEPLLVDPAASVVFAFHGAVDHVQLERLLNMAETFCTTSDDATATRKRVMNVLVEGLENLQHHAMDDLAEASFAALVRGRDAYHLVFGNAVPLAMAALLTHRIGILNDMDDADLKEHYLKLLSNSARSQHGGAGLGLLTMARKCMKPIQVSSHRISPEAAMFVIGLRVDRCAQAAPDA